MTCVLLVTGLSGQVAFADTDQARCDVFPAGEDKASKVLPCTFSQRQGHVTIYLSDGVEYDLIPTEEAPGNYKDQNGRAVYRNSGLGKDGLIFRTPDESIFVYWDETTLPDFKDPANPETNFSAPYDTDTFDATTRLSCSFDPDSYPAARGNPAFQTTDCPAGINRGSEAGQTMIAVMRPDQTERIIRIDGDMIESSIDGEITKELVGDNWTITIDAGAEVYVFPQAVIDGG
jgi:hypothetical protein